MSNAKHSPTPWSVGKNSQGWATHVEDAEGVEVASCWGAWGKDCTEPATSDAALIVEAVNERDRLRDLVRRLLPLAEIAEKYADADAEAIKGICALKGVDPSVVDAIREKNTNLLREARAAIGEGEE